MTYSESENSSLLVEAIFEARRVLAEHADYLAGNETRTRALLIDTVLNALDWDIRSPSRVWLEHRTNGNAMDYVLLSEKSTFIAVVEAKAANFGLRDRFRRDTSGYAQELGAPFAVLTTGSRWEAWEMAQSPRKENIILEVNLTSGSVAEVASKLERLHRDNLGR